MLLKKIGNLVICLSLIVNLLLGIHNHSYDDEHIATEEPSFKLCNDVSSHQNDCLTCLLNLEFKKQFLSHQKKINFHQSFFIVYHQNSYEFLNIASRIKASLRAPPYLTSC